ncbi:MAG: hypothetical protein ACD_26C00136G0003 [uncultured bacterium]|nr:MAG: hypothetical protein ACD_26C00136G0003 [uncultured bacterium]
MAEMLSRVQISPPPLLAGRILYNLFMLGYIFALLSSIFFSLYIIPRKLSKLNPVNFSFFMSIGFFISTVVLYLFKSLLQLNEVFSPVLFLSVIAGIIWATSFALFVSSAISSILNFLDLRRCGRSSREAPIKTLSIFA